ncbi:MAG: 2-amino-4-hydroxy-6-hydroxymethyldihydropteridine diphosphokinase [Bacteroides sp.]|nr:2-amino-4-hydroxy-6-hydroxymethyldihydropteridine diphosphokinase [Bacteroides sp.]MBD5333119.1 2-amino-4-hydroxy-6-hydroxymethyldihydropteridine diphosphokinase [Bacteroides sp.]
MESYATCTIGLGSNSPDREEQIKNAIDHIQGLLADSHVSQTYETEAVNGLDAPYLNAVIHGRSPLNAADLTAFLKDWEKRQGRSFDSNENDAHIVVIDLDLVIFDSRILRPRDFDRHYFNKGYSELLADGAFQNDLI